MKLRHCAFALVALVAAACLHAAGWTEDYPGALLRAKKEKKLILLNFTGSDWNGWSKKLDAEVFGSVPFSDYAKKRLVLVTVDFPRFRPISPALRRQNEGLKKQFEVGGVPAVLVIDANERILFSQEGYLPGGPDPLIKSIEDSVSAAPQASGPTIVFPR